LKYSSSLVLILISLFFTTANISSQEIIPEELNVCIRGEQNYCECLSGFMNDRNSKSILAYAYYFFGANCTLDDLVEKKRCFERARNYWAEIGYAGHRYLNTYFYTIEDVYATDFNTDTLDHYIAEAQSLQILSKPKFLRTYSGILRFKAWTARAIGDTQLSFEVYEDFLESSYFSLLTEDAKAWFYCNFADILIDIPNPAYHERAQQLHNASIELSDNTRLYWANQYGLARYFEEKNSFDHAIKFYLEYYHFFEKHEFYKNMITASNSLGNVYLKKGNLSKAIAWYNKAIEYSKSESSFSEFVHSPYISLSKIYQKENAIDKSTAIINEAVQLLYDSLSRFEDLKKIKQVDIKYPLAHLELLIEVGNSLSLRKATQVEALEYFQKAFDFFHSQFDNVTYNKSKYQKKKDFDYLFQNLISLAIEMGDMKQVFQLLDEGKHSILEYDMQKKTNAFNIESKLSLLNTDTSKSIIQYGATTDSIIAVVSHGGKYDFFSLGEITYIHDLILKYIRLLRDIGKKSENNDDFYSLSIMLYELLIKPLHIKSESIKIVPNEYLSLLPFESLITNVDDKESFLLKNYIISYSLSLKLDRLLNSNTNQVSGITTFTPVFDKNPNGDIAIVRGSNMNISNLYDLIYSKDETASIREIMGNDDQEVNKKALFNSMEGDQVLHFSGHAVNYFEDAELSFLAFNSNISNDENKLTLSEISNATCNNEMVVLSACDTGTGEVIAGEGVLSLARGFFQAGARSVISTLWSVNDKSSSLIMKNFYTHLNDGMNKDFALRQAKLDYLNNTKDPDYLHPFYWAGFVAVGDMSPVLQKLNSNIYLGLGLFLLSIFGLGYFLKRKTITF